MQTLQCVIPLRDCLSGAISAHASMLLLGRAIGDAQFTCTDDLKSFRSWLNFHIPFVMPTTHTVGGSVQLAELQAAPDEQVC